jgi:hypothetical protein
MDVHWAPMGALQAKLSVLPTPDRDEAQPVRRPSVSADKLMGATRMINFIRFIGFIAFIGA